jgi:hypothetical protein
MKKSATDRAVDAAIQQYARDHWGERGSWDVKKLPAADPRRVSIVLGELVSVVYRTKKGGDRELTDYEHHFSRPLPLLSYHAGGLIISGGKYHVSTRGIID